MKKFKFLTKDNYTEVFPNNICEEYYDRIEELEQRNRALHHIIADYQNRLFQAIGNNECNLNSENIN